MDGASGTGLTYLNARYYDPATSRFISPDPLMVPSDPRTLDPYRYAENNPIVFTDASGLRPIGQYDCAGIGCNVTNYGTYTPPNSKQPKPAPKHTSPTKPSGGGLLGGLTSGFDAFKDAAATAVDTIGSTVTNGVATVNGLAQDARSAIASNASQAWGATKDWWSDDVVPWWGENGDKVLLVVGIVVAVACIGVTAGAGAVACVAGGLAITGATVWDGKANRGMSNAQAITVGALGVVGSVGGPLAAIGMKTAAAASAASGVAEVAQVTKLTVPEIRLANGIFGGPSLAVGAGEMFALSNG